MGLNYRFKRLEGQVFGRLTAVECVGKDSNNRAIWECLCICGNKHNATSGNLKSGNVQSCGCLQEEQRGVSVGDVFGRLTVLSYSRLVHTASNRHYSLWLVRCSCGNLSEAAANNLLRGKTKSCGCGKGFRHGLYKTKEYRQSKQREYYEKKLLHDTEWTVQLEVFLRQLFTSCVVCGNTENLEVDHVLPLSKGYGLKPGNATILCGSCNSSKNNRWLSELPDSMRESIIESALYFKESWEKSLC